jgi:chromosome segregation ATPase
MTTPTLTVSGILQRVTVCLLTGALLTEIGCVSQSAYERVKAETQEHTRALESVRNEVKGLDLQIAELQAANRHEDASAAELRAAVQREEEQLPVMRQRAEAMLTSLKGQVAALMNQSWTLARKIADLRHESASLESAVAQYKQEVEETHAAALETSVEEESAIAQAVAAEPSTSPAQELQVAQLTESAVSRPSLSPSTPSLPSPSMTADPPGTDDTWVDMILSWLTTFWNWLFS